MPAPKWRTWAFLLDSRSGAQGQQSLPLPCKWGSLTRKRKPGVWTRARNSWRPTDTRAACPKGTDPRKRSAGGMCTASIQRAHPWAPPQPGPQPNPAPPRWAPPESASRGLFNPQVAAQARPDAPAQAGLHRRIPPHETPWWHQWQPTRNRYT